MMEKIANKLSPDESKKIIEKFKAEGHLIEENAEYFIIPKENGKRIFIPKRDCIIHKKDSSVSQLPIEEELRQAIND